jgi:hypothetical protein
MIVDSAVEFAAVLDKHAVKNNLFRMEEEATKITLDVIGKAICGHDFGLLRSNDNEFGKTLRKQLSWMPDLQNPNPFNKHSMYNLYSLFFNFHCSKTWKVTTLVTVFGRESYHTIIQLIVQYSNIWCRSYTEDHVQVLQEQNG